MATHTLTEMGFSPAGNGPERGPYAEAVSPRFRLGYAVRFGLAVVIGAFAAGAVVCAVLAADLGAYAENLTILGGVQKWVVGAAILSALIQVALAGALVSGWALLASHKIAGPMVRLVGLLRGVAQGRLPGPVAFRRGDQVGKVESEFNELSRLLRERHERIARKLGEVQSTVRQLRREPGALGGGDRRAAASALREQAKELAALLAEAGEPDRGSTQP